MGKFFGGFILVMLSFLIVIVSMAIVKQDKKIKKFDFLIIQGDNKYRTDKIDTLNNGIKFVDYKGKNIYIKGNYIIETNSDY